ncbi:universal stress protein [Frateuria defendens]|uniref:universal stress protein n=1 Tax=Frateuria defendens TaxID=2219559 RepID=UPI00066FF7ED|nr:universal stress protein [Frateuria defendens]
MLELIVHIEAQRDEAALLRFAFGLARRHRAHLTGIRIVALDAMLIALPDALTVLEDEERIARSRHDWWLEQCRRHGVEGDWEVHRGFYPNVLARRASLSDLILGSLSARDANVLPGLGLGLLGRTIVIDSAPLLLVPDTWEGGHGGVEKIAIAWNGSAEAARAVRAALPLLAAAKEIVVLDGEQPAQADEHHPALPLRAWLARQGLASQWLPLAAAGDKGEAILAKAAEAKADLLVMGAWGHSRMSELLLGGVTRYALQHSRLPLLLAH